MNNLKQDKSSTNDRINNLAKFLNFRVEQKNGCRYFGPEKNLVGNKEPDSKKHEVYVARVPSDLYEDELYEFFSQAGEIFKIKIYVTFSGTTKGFAFVKFKNECSARRACLLSELSIRPNTRLIVNPSTEHNVVELQFRDMFMPQQVVEEILEKLLQENHLPSLFSTSYNPTCNSCTVTFEEHRDAILARKALIKVANFVWGRNVHVDWEFNEAVFAREAKKKQHEAAKLEKLLRKLRVDDNSSYLPFENNLYQENKGALVRKTPVSPLFGSCQQTENLAHMNRALNESVSRPPTVNREHEGFYQMFKAPVRPLLESRQQTENLAQMNRSLNESVSWPPTGYQKPEEWSCMSKTLNFGMKENETPESMCLEPEECMTLQYKSGAKQRPQGPAHFSFFS